MKWDKHHKITKSEKKCSATLQIALNYLSEKEIPSKIAIDLGCGGLTDTLKLVEDNWFVYAIDREEVIKQYVNEVIFQPYLQQIHISIQHFESLQIPINHLTNASFSLPFCKPDFFDACWLEIYSKLNTGGIFCGHFFGLKDSWSNNPSMTFHSENQLKNLFNKFRFIEFTETSKEGKSLSGEVKFWHVYHIVAEKL